MIYLDLINLFDFLRFDCICCCLRNLKLQVRFRTQGLSVLSLWVLPVSMDCRFYVWVFPFMQDKLSCAYVCMCVCVRELKFVWSLIASRCGPVMSRRLGLRPPSSQPVRWIVTECAQRATYRLCRRPRRCRPRSPSCCRTPRPAACTRRCRS